MIPLNAQDMEYLQSHKWPMSVMRGAPDFKHTKFIPDPARAKVLDAFLCQDYGFFVEMDNHGVNISVFVYRETKDGPLLGFLVGSSSEECFYGTDYFDPKTLGPFEVQPEERRVTVYARADGKSFT